MNNRGYVHTSFSAFSFTYHRVLFLEVYIFGKKAKPGDTLALKKIQGLYYVLKSISSSELALH